MNLLRLAPACIRASTRLLELARPPLLCFKLMSSSSSSSPSSPSSSSASSSPVRPVKKRSRTQSVIKSARAVPEVVRSASTIDAVDADEDDASKTKPKRRRSPSVAVGDTLRPFSVAAIKAPEFMNASANGYTIMCWNVAGWRAAEKKGARQVISTAPTGLATVDVVCLTETKCATPIELDGYFSYQNHSQLNAGHSGVALLTRQKPIAVTYGIGDARFDADGRVITAEFDGAFIVACYTPHAGMKLEKLNSRMEWDAAFRTFCHALNKPFVVCGDLNVARTPLDIHNAKTNARAAGFTQQERTNMETLITQENSIHSPLIDAYRHCHPEERSYSYYSYKFNARNKGIGWRLDYFLLSSRLAPLICDCVHGCEYPLTARDDENRVRASDHLPCYLSLRSAPQ